MDETLLETLLLGLTRAELAQWVRKLSIREACEILERQRILQEETVKEQDAQMSVR